MAAQRHELSRWPIFSERNYIPHQPISSFSANYMVRASAESDANTKTMMANGSSVSNALVLPCEWECLATRANKVHRVRVTRTQRSVFPFLMWIRDSSGHGWLSSSPSRGVVRSCILQD